MPDPAKPPTGEEPGQNPAGEPQVDKGTPPDNPEDAPKFTQKDLDRIAAKTRDEEKRKAKEAKEKEDRERAEAEAKEQGKFEKLANDRQAKIEELEPKVSALGTERDSLKSLLVDIAKAELKTLPEEVRDISPAEYAEDKTLTNPQAVLAWLPKGKALAAKLDAQPAKPGHRADPKPNGGPGDSEKDKKARASARQAYRE